MDASRAQEIKMSMMYNSLACKYVTLSHSHYNCDAVTYEGNKLSGLVDNWNLVYCTAIH